MSDKPEEAPQENKPKEVPLGWLGTNNPPPVQYIRPPSILPPETQPPQVITRIVEQPSLSYHVGVATRDWFKSRIRSVWRNLKADRSFCNDAFKATFGAGWWAKMITALSFTNKWLNRVASVSVFAGSIWLYLRFVYPYAGNAGTAIIVLSLLVFCSLVTIRVTRKLYEGVLSSAMEMHGQLPALTEQVNGLSSQLAETSKELARLKEKIKPRLVISYDGGRYDHKDVRDGKLIHRVVRVQIENLSEETTVENIKVKAESFTTHGTKIFKVPFRVSHDKDGHKSNGFSLSPGETECVDIVEKVLGRNEINLCHTLSSLIQTYEKSLKIRVLVTANQQPKQVKSLRVEVDDVELLHCRAMKTKNVGG